MSELPEKQAKRLHALIQEAETNLAAAKELLISIIGDDGAVITPKGSPIDEVGGKVIEGVFDGQKMAGPDGKEYPVPANYASKSKLVEGDILKLRLQTTAALFTSKVVQSIVRRLLVHSSSTTVRTTWKQMATNTAFF